LGVATEVEADPDLLALSPNGSEPEPFEFRGDRLFE
jgi:hypothetical protein